MNWFTKLDILKQRLIRDNVVYFIMTVSALALAYFFGVSGVISGCVGWLMGFLFVVLSDVQDAERDMDEKIEYLNKNSDDE